MFVAFAIVISVVTACTPEPRYPLPTPTTAPATSATPTPLRVVLPLAGEYSWAFLPLHANARIEGSKDASRTTNRIESVIKVWLVADSLHSDDNVSSLELANHAEMIGRSDDWLAERAYQALGSDNTIHRMVKRCGLRRVGVVSGYWARTRFTTTDLARLGQCISDGRAAGKRWTPWLLRAMTTPKDAGAFGVVKETGPLAFMNGWTDYGDYWVVNCLAIGPAWVLAVMTEYPSYRGLHHGASVCASVAKQLAAAGKI